MRKKKIIRFIVLFLIPIVGISLVSYKVAQLSKQGLVVAVTPKIVSLETKHIYSDTLKTEIEGFCERCIFESRQGALDAKRMCQKIKNNFKIVQAVKWEFSSLENATLCVIGIKPRFIVNRTFVLGNKKRLFPMHLFDNYPVEQLKKIEVADKHFDTKLSIGVYKFLQKIPSGYFDRYTIRYESMNRIELRSLREKNKLVIIADEQCFFSHDILNRLSLVEDDFIESRHVLYGRRLSMRNKQLVCDLRFKNGVYVKAEKLV